LNNEAGIKIFQNDAFPNFSTFIGGKIKIKHLSKKRTLGVYLWEVRDTR